MLIVLLAVAVAALVGLLAWWNVRIERQRIAALTAWAKQKGWTFDPRRSPAPELPYALFHEGHSRRMRHAARRRFTGLTPGLDEAAIQLFEYHYATTTSTGKVTTTQHHHFACALVDPGADLGEVLIRAETWGDKLTQALGLEDIDLEDAEFSRRFVVQARDRRAAYDLIDGAMMRFLCGGHPPRLETHGRQLFAYAPAKATPAEYDALVGIITGFLAQIPRPLVNTERVRRGLAPLLEAGNAASSSRSSPAAPSPERGSS